MRRRRPARRAKITGMRNDPRRGRGLEGEEMAAAHLRAHGLTILARNPRCRFGELDLVCRDRDVLVIVEVRRRARADFGGALASITWRKQRRIVRTTEFLMLRHAGWRGSKVRFDVIAIDDAARLLQWVVDAFRPT